VTGPPGGGLTEPDADGDVREAAASRDEGVPAAACGEAAAAVAAPPVAAGERG